jgi:hypothetical protein
MPTYTWVEDRASRSATIHRLNRRSQNTYKKSWKIFGTDDDIAVHADVNLTLWTDYMFWQYPGQPLNKLQAESYTLEYLGDKAWQLTVTYVSRGADDDTQPQPIRRSRSFDTSGATTHISQQPSYGAGSALGGRTTSQEKRYPVGGDSPAPDQQGAIGVDGDTVQGVDIVVPALQWTENYDVPHQYITDDYVKIVSSLTGTTNNQAFRSFRAGEVLFMGANGSQDWDEDKGNSPWSLSFKFVASPNADGTTLPTLTIGSITGIEKKGHEYLWVRYWDQVVDATLLKRPTHVYVNQVYPEADFSLLGIGVT